MMITTLSIGELIIPPDRPLLEYSQHSQMRTMNEKWNKKKENNSPIVYMKYIEQIVEEAGSYRIKQRNEGKTATE